jgi:hypothetical protein
VHYTEFLIDHCTKHIHGYPLREFVASGMTHSHGRVPVFGNFLTGVFDVANPQTFNLGLNHRNTESSRYYDLNFGLIDFYIDPENPENDAIEWSIRDLKGNEVHRKVFLAEDFK